MKLAGRLVVLGGLALAGCETMHDAAVSTFHVLDAPANYVRKKIAGEPPEPPPTVADASDTVTPGHPVNPTPTPETQRRVAVENRPGSRTRGSIPESSPTITKSPSPSSQQTASTQSSQFPTAKPVPGK